MILFVFSTKDEAGVNIAENLIESYGFEMLDERFQGKPTYVKKIHDKEIKLIEIKDEPINAQYMDRLFDPELIVFLSKHSSKSGIPTLCVHTPGNFREADLGGLPGKISISPANAMRRALQEMFRMKTEYDLKYEVSYECTHHGPSLDVPTMFVEVGSSEKQWRDKYAAMAVAEAAIESVNRRDECTVVIGIGGPHYNKKFTDLALRDEFAFGHMIPNYAIPNVDLETIKQCISRTLEKVEFSVLDWKGIKGAFKKKIVEYLETLGLEMYKV